MKCFNPKKHMNGGLRSLSRRKLLIWNDKTFLFLQVTENILSREDLDIKIMLYGEIFIALIRHRSIYFTLHLIDWAARAGRLDACLIIFIYDFWFTTYINISLFATSLLNVWIRAWSYSFTIFDLQLTLIYPCSQPLC